MCNIHRERKKLVPIDYSAMIAWLESKQQPIKIKNLGGGGHHIYKAQDNVIVIDERNKILEEQWKKTCVAMATDIPRERLDITTEYSEKRNYANPSIPVLCWALCEELMHGNQVWNY